MKKQWFQHENYISLNISKSKTGERKPTSKVDPIKDATYINKLVKTISNLPLNAEEMMKSFGDGTETWTLKFCNKDGECDEIEFYRGKIKTPNTGIYVEKIQSEIDISKEIENLITPRFEVAIPVIKGHITQFKDFTVEYLGSEDSPEAPVTASFVTQDYKIVPKKGESINIQIVSGQNPPQPQTFTVDKVKYALVSDELKSGFSLFPHYYAITKPTK